MKFTYNWLKDFVDISFKPEELADKLTMAGLEVTSLERFHDDYVFEIEVTSNRPDWLSVIGVAREVAAITSKVQGARCKVQDFMKKAKHQAPSTKHVVITIEDKAACPFYSARVIQNVKVGHSPEWLVKRILAVGLRPVNNIVDITNYVLFTTGQPLHAFDLDKLSASRQSPVASQKIIIRRAKRGEEIITIDGIKRMLNENVLVIASDICEVTGDRRQATGTPIAIAGIMGGEETEVSESTQNILLESAYFSPLVVRGASRLLSLSSDSSYRFERSVDKSAIVNSSNFALRLILENASGEIGKFYKVGSERVPKKIISFKANKANRVIGQNIPLHRIKSIFRTLEFKIISSDKDVLKIEPPCFRQDIKSEADLTEEICRLYGYEKIPLAQAAIKPQQIEEDKILFIQEKTREILTGLGLSEVISYSLLSEEILKKAKIDVESAVYLESPLSRQQEVLRPTLIIGLLDTLRKNLESGNKSCLFFEIGDCFARDKEERFLAIIMENAGFLNLKGISELLLNRLSAKDYGFSYFSSSLFIDGECANLTIGDKKIGLIGQIKEEILLDFKIKARDVLVLEINLGQLKPFVDFKKTYKKLPQYPSIIRDLSIIVEEGLPYNKILGMLKGSAGEYLEDIKFKAIYRSEGIGEGKKSVTVSLEFRSPKSTLKDSEVNTEIENIIQKAFLKLGATLRA